VTEDLVDMFDKGNLVDNLNNNTVRYSVKNKFKTYLALYVPATLISIILFFVLPQEQKYLILVPVLVAGVIYGILKNDPKK
jgi:hypothetical protein